MSEAVKLVFKLPTLLDKILQYTIYNEDALVTRSLFAVRMVCHEWVKSSSRILTQNGTTFQVQVVSRSSDKVKHRRMMKFVHCFADKKEGAEFLKAKSIIPIKLIFHMDFLTSSNFQLLLYILTKCKRLIIAISLNLPKEDCKIPRIRQRLHFPILRQVSVNFSNGKRALETANVHSPNYADEVYQECPIGLNFLQAILNASEGLKCVQISSEHCIFPNQFGRIQLPKYLQVVNFDCILEDEHIDLFRHNKLQYLTTLLFQLNVIPMSEEISLIVQLTKNTLKHLQIDGIESDGIVRQPTLLDIPIVSHLEAIEIKSTDVKLVCSPISLRKRLPQLELLHIGFQRDLYAQLWLQSGSFPNVHTVCISIVTPSYQQSHPNFYHAVDYGCLRKVHSACPNVKHLSICTTLNDLSAIAYICMYIKSIKSLRIDFFGNIPFQAHGLLDEAFLGLPASFASSLSENQAHYQEIKLTDNGQNIQNLTDLKTLILATQEKDEDEISPSLTSRLLIREGFNKIRTLSTLGLIGKFYVPPELLPGWNRRNQYFYHLNN